MNDDVVLSDALTAWLRQALARPSLRVVDVARPKASASNQTVILTVEWTGDGGEAGRERLVCRSEPVGPQLFLHPDVILEGRVLRAVAAASPVPVPDVIAFEPGREVIGSPFFVMSYINGRVLPDIPSCHAAGWLLDCTPSQRATHWDNGLRALVDISRIQADGNVDFLWTSELHESGLAQLVVATRQWFDWVSDGREFDVLSRAMDYVEKNRPDHDDAVLNWGDSRPGNIIFGADGGVEAVLDWEIASLGPAEVDLGWWLVMEEFCSHGLGAPPLPGVPDEAAQIARWEKLLGRPARDLAYFKILAALRFAIFCARSSDVSLGKSGPRPDPTPHTHTPVGDLFYRTVRETLGSLLS
jgi:aminoglycoside phosphotransferase (APT) family kinase protein